MNAYDFVMIKRPKILRIGNGKGRKGMPLLTMLVLMWMRFMSLLAIASCLLEYSAAEAFNVRILISYSEG